MTKCDDGRRIPSRLPLPLPPPPGVRALPLLLLLLFVAATIPSLSDGASLWPLRDGRRHHHQQHGFLLEEMRRGNRTTARRDVDAQRYLRYPVPNTVGRNHDGEQEDPRGDQDRDGGFVFPAVLEGRERDCEEQFRKQRLVELDEYVTYVVLVATEYIVATAAGGDGAGAESGTSNQTGKGELVANNVGRGWNVTALRDEWHISEEGTSSDRARHWQDFAERQALNALPMLPDGTLRTFAGYACRYTRRRKDGEVQDFCRRYHEEGRIDASGGAASVLKDLPRGLAIRLASVEGKTRRRRVVKELCLDPFSSNSTYSPSSTSVQGESDRDEALQWQHWDKIVDAMRKYYVEKGLIVATTIVVEGGEGEQELGVGQGQDNATATVNVGVNGSTTVTAMELPVFTMMLLLRPSTMPSDMQAVVNGTVLAGEASAMLSDVLSFHHYGNGTMDSVSSSSPLNGSGNSFPTTGDDSQLPELPKFLGVNLTASIVERDAADQSHNEIESGHSSPSLLLPRTEVVATLYGTAYYQRGYREGRGGTMLVPSAGEMRERVEEAFGADGGLNFISRYLQLSSDETLRRVKRVYVRYK